MKTAKRAEEEVRPIYLQIREDLLHAMEGKGFHKLPSEREICEKYGVCRPTVQKALSYFLDKDMIVRRPGKGSFLRQSAQERPQAPKALKFVIRRDWRAWEGDIYFGLAAQGVFNALAGQQVKLEMEQFSDALLYQLLRDGETASVWLSPEAAEIEAMKTLADADRRVVALNRRVEHPGVGCASSDHEADGAAAAKLLLGQGRRRLSLLCAESDHVIFEERRKGAVAALAGSDASFEGSFFPVQGWAESFKAKLDELLSDKASAPDGLIINNASLLNSAFEVFAARGLRAPEDIGIACFNDRQEQPKPGVALLCQQIVKLGRLAGELALSPAQGGAGKLLLKSIVYERA
jgi:DNA-binding LacI/PurR family transcriptional regulator/DNA-binding transcriptional regulator YhcF (GntR family)